MLAIEAASVVDGDVDGSGNLILTKHDGSKINAGSVIGPPGPQGPVGSFLSVLSAKSVLDVGLANQIRAGRQLSPADFGNLGLSAPLGLWNLSDLTDASGNGRNLLNKGAVPFASGINGGANTAAQFIGSTAQALYIPDTGAADPFRLKTGSVGCWFRTAKINQFEVLIGKYTVAGNQCSWYIGVEGSSRATFQVSTDGANTWTGGQVIGNSSLADDRWHFVVLVIDGTQYRIYVDGILEGVLLSSGLPYSSSSPFNIGSASGDGATASVSPFYGRIDEVFFTSDVLTDDQIRNLYCAKIGHTLGSTPSRITLNVRRRRKGAALVASDFPIQPLRLHNFSGGSLGDEGSNNVGLTNNGAAVSVAGADGSTGNAFSYAGAQSLSSIDTGLPSALTARSYGCWFKTNSTTIQALIGWGSYSANVAFMCVLNSPAGQINSSSGADGITGPFVADGQWHFAVTVEDNTAIDGVKRKLYVDGRLVGTSTVLNAINLVGANGFRIGALPSGSWLLIGQADGAFVCGYALTAEQIYALYAKGSQALTPSPKNVGDHIEAMDSASLLAIFDSMESQHQIDLSVAA